MACFLYLLPSRVFRRGAASNRTSLFTTALKFSVRVRQLSSPPSNTTLPIASWTSLQQRYSRALSNNSVEHFPQEHLNIKYVGKIILRCLYMYYAMQNINKKPWPTSLHASRSRKPQPEIYVMVKQTHFTNGLSPNKQEAILVRFQCLLTTLVTTLCLQIWLEVVTV